jgi:hypothetical protein
MMKFSFSIGLLALAGTGFAEIKSSQPASKTATQPAAQAETAKPGELSASHRAAIERLLTALQAEKNMDLSMRAGASLGMGLSNDQIQSMPKAQREKFQKAMKRAMDIMSKEVNWNSIKERVIESYAKTFTEQEATDIATIMESPAGKLLVSKQSLLAGDLMRISQEKMKTVMPKIAAIIQEEMQKPSE